MKTILVITLVSFIGFVSILIYGIIDGRRQVKKLEREMETSGMDIDTAIRLINLREKLQKIKNSKNENEKK
jgi:predicted Holliday junction resolvase-like endonuclease